MPYETYSKRQKRLSQSGQADVYQYDTFSPTFRTQICFIWRAAIGHPIYAMEYWDIIHDVLSEELGVKALSTAGRHSSEYCQDFLMSADPGHVIDILELSFHVINTSIRNQREQPNDTASRAVTRSPNEAIYDLNHRFREHSIGFEFINDQLVRKDSQYLHEEAVKPALGLLNGPGFSGPEDEFLRAHEHLRAGEYQDAILDANNAFESTMKAICELRGWTYDKGATAKALIGIMFDNDLIPRPLTSHFDHLRLVLEAGLPTVRNKTGGHGQGSVPIVLPEYLAGYALHLAATNIVLLVEAHKAKS